MNSNYIGIQTIDKLPNDVAYNEILQTLYIKAKFTNGIKDFE